MRIGVISDTHIPNRAKAIPSEVLDALKGVDMILHAGDLVDLSILDVLKSVCPDVKAVWGNMDPLKTRKGLPEKQIITIGKYRFGLTHGKGSPAFLIDTITDIFKNDKVDVIVFGHSHSPINEKRGKILYFNPGSITDTVFSPFNSYGIIEINDEIKTNIVRI
ncbi:MAG: metallophosphoesterase family protein [Candidatus Omnitrophota bacterium]|jgi:putative phosphoesterase